VFEVVQSIEHDGHPCKEDVVDLVENVFVEGEARKDGDEAVPEEREYEDGILVEHVGDQVRVSSVGFSSMHRQKSF